MIPARQPARQMVRSYFDLDVRMSDQDLLAAQEDDETSPRTLALRVLDLFDADACQHVPDVVITTREPMELLAP